MKKTHKILIFALLIGLLVSATGCGVTGNSSFNAVERLETQEICIAFRLDDKVGDAVTAALLELEAEGEIAVLSQEWFGSDVSLLKGDEDALSKLEDVPENRTLIVGYDDAHLPFSGGSGGTLEGFDIDLARLISDKLGWRIRFVPVNVAEPETELGSGNVDCILGGFPYDAKNTKISFSPPYMSNTIIVASKSDSGIRTLGNLSDKTLAVSTNGIFSTILEKYPEVSESVEFLMELPGGVDGCFEALENGACDAIVTDTAGIEYYK